MDLYKEMLRVFELALFGRMTEEQVEQEAVLIDKLWSEATEEDLQEFALKVTKNGNANYEEVLKITKETRKEVRHVAGK